MNTNICVIKPESIQIMDDGVTPTGPNVFKTKVDVNDYTGTATRYEMVTPEGFMIKASEVGYSNHPQGTELYVYMRKNRMTVIKAEE